MKTLRFTAFLFYRYYAGGRRPALDPYSRTILSLIFLGFLHLLQVLLLLGKADFIRDSRNIEWSFVLLFLIFPIYWGFTKLVTKKQLREMKKQYADDRDKVFNGYIWLIVYLVLLLPVLFFIAYWKSL